MFLVMIFLIYSQKNNFGLILKKPNTLKNLIGHPKYNGFDYRYENNEIKLEAKKNESANLYKIYKHFENKNLLDILTNQNVSITTKMLLLQDNRIKSTSLYAGGLMKDFDFDFDFEN